VFRINCSHINDHAILRDTINKIRTAQAQLLTEQRHIGILVDLQGPKFRTGLLEGMFRIHIKYIIH